MAWNEESRASMKQRREALGWSRAELARRAVMNSSSVGSIENGRMITPYPVQRRKILKALAAGEAEKVS